MKAENNYERMEKISEECQRMKDSWKGKAAKEIPEIPDKPI